MTREKKSKPGDYPIFAFRVSEDEKDLLSREIEAVSKKLNGRLADDEKIWRKNEVIVEALKLGLEQLKRGKNR